MEIPAYVQILVWDFGLVAWLSAFLLNSNIRAMGSVSSQVNMGDTKRLSP